MNYFVIFLAIIGMVLTPYLISDTFASCGQPYDAAFHWLDLPCHDTQQTDEERKADWAEFYYFKGADWMEYKTNEFETLVKDGMSEEEWLGHGYDYIPENWYFWNYYQLFGNNPPQIQQKPVKMPSLEKQTCDESCKDRISESTDPYICTKEYYSQNYECAHQSALQPTIFLTSTDETGKEMTFRPTEATVSLGINNTIRWHNTSYKTTISNQENVYKPSSIPFNDIQYQVLDKVGNYTFYDISNPYAKISINVIPLDKDFNPGKPITKHGYFSDVRFNTFRANTDSQNFIHSITIQNNNSINVTLDNTMNAQYAVHEESEMTSSTNLSIGETIISGCSYHHDSYSRLFYHTLEKINSENDTVEFKETVDYVQGNECNPLYSDPSKILEIYENPNNFNYPVPGAGMIAHLYSLKTQIESGLNYDQFRCNEGHVLIQKYDGSPACVTESTKQKLVERGWTKQSITNGANTDTNQDNWQEKILRVQSRTYCSVMDLDRIPKDQIIYQKRVGTNALMLNVNDDDLKQVPHLQEMILAMNNSTGFVPYQYQEDTLVKEISSSGESQHSMIWNWLKEMFKSQYTERQDGSFSSYFEYGKYYYNISWALC